VVFLCLSREILQAGRRTLPFTSPPIPYLLTILPFFFIKSEIFTTSLNKKDKNKETPIYFRNCAGDFQGIPYDTIHHT
jgi:hypothetical protein